MVVKRVALFFSLTAAAIDTSYPLRPFSLLLTCTTYVKDAAKYNPNAIE